MGIDPLPSVSRTMASSVKVRRLAHLTHEAMRLTGEMFDVFGPAWEAVSDETRAAIESIVEHAVDHGVHPTMGAAALHQLYCQRVPDLLIEGEAITVFAVLPGYRRAQYDCAAALLGTLGAVQT